jgi:hypothetical protein
MDDVQIVMHAASYHFEGAGHEGFNPGAAIRVPRARSFLTVGGYRNSLGRESVYAGIGYTVADYGWIRFNVLGGAVTGYQIPVAPALVPEVEIVRGRVSLMFGLIPPLHAGSVNVDAAVTLSVGKAW